MSILRLFAARVIAGFVATFVVWLSTKHINIDHETQQQLVDGLVTWSLGIFSVFYPVVHKLIDRWLNPGDAASTHLAHEERAEVAALRRAD